MANIIMLGPPGSGKGTQAERISEKFGWPQISTGNILRHAIENKTQLGLQARGYIDRGELVPDKVVDGIVSERLSHKDCAKGFILDGFPRDLEQAKALEKITQIDAVFDIKVPDETLIKRLSARRVCDCGETYHLIHNPPKKGGICDKCGKKVYQRKDDTEATISHRLSVYHQQTEPLISFYRKRNLLIEIDGIKNIEDIFASIKSHLM
jgi:adenylate kinase